MRWLPIVAVDGSNRSPSMRNSTVVLGSEISGTRAAIIFVRICSWVEMYCSRAISGR